MPSSSARSNGSPRRVNSFGRRSWTNGSSQTSKPCARCSRKLQLPLTVAQRREVAVVGPVEELLARRLLLLALEVRQQVVAVEVDLVVAAHGRVAREQLLLDVGLAGRGQQRRQHVLVREHVVVDRARLDHARPSDQGRHPVAAFPVGCSSRRGTASCRRPASSSPRRRCRSSTSRWCCRRCRARRACRAAARPCRRARPCHRDRCRCR